MIMSEPSSVMQDQTKKDTTDDQIDEKDQNYQSAVEHGSHSAHNKGINEHGEDDLSLSGQDDEQDEDYQDIRYHPSYQQVMLDVNRCAGRLEHIRQCYFHRTDDDEPPEDLTEELEQQKTASDLESRDTCHLSCHKQPEINTDSTKLRRLANDLQYRRQLKKKLAKLIVRLLIRKPDLHYYQGFHDVCLTYMTIYGDTVALEKLDGLIDSHFSAFMQPTMNETQEFLALIPIIIGLQDQKLQDHLEKAEVGTIFALSWVITWFSHVIPNECDLETIFYSLQNIDDPHLVLYLCAEIVLLKKDELLQMEREMSTMHHFLCQVPRKEKLPIEGLLEKANLAFNKWPPHVVKDKLSQHRIRLQMQNYNLIKRLAEQFYPTVTSLVSSPASRRAVIVFIVASALALQFDRWIR